MKKYKITVVGAGYVGMSLSVLLAQSHHVTLFDIDPEKVRLVSNNQSTVQDLEIDSFLANESLDLSATQDMDNAFIDKDFIVIQHGADHLKSLKRVDSKKLGNLIDRIISENKYSKIFLCTEDLNYLKIIKKRYKDKVIFLKNVYRSYNDDAFKKYPQNLHRYKLGRDILIESLLISKCKGFVYTNTNVSEFVKFLDKKKKINFFLIQNNFNSSNPYIAKWLWYYKNLFPQFLGGFKKTTYVKKN